MDVFAEHGIAGMVGLIFNALFGADYIIGLDGVNTGVINGGWLNHNYKQLYIQVAYIVACTAYAFLVSALLALIINLIPGLHLRASEEAELLGMDDDQLGEFAYDYVEVRRDYLAWTPAKDEPEKTESNVNPSDRHGIPEHSDMIQGQSPDHSSQDGGHAHTGIQGDRHGIAAENVEKEKAGMLNGHQNGALAPSS
jgi:Amt family ammonium transporter